MSFLNSVLSSLNDGSHVPIAVPQVRPTKAPPAANVTSSLATKRKAEDDLYSTAAKTSKIIANRPKLETPNRANTPMSGKSKPATATPPASYKVLDRSKLIAPLSATTPKAPPKKGSFAEILARASQSQSTQVVGKIMHKPKDKLSAKKEIALQKALALKNKKGLQRTRLKVASSGRIGNGSGTTKARGDMRPDLKDPKSGYQGTSKPKPVSSYQGTMKPKPQSSYQGTIKPGSQKQRKKGYDSEPDRIQGKPLSGSHQREAYSDIESAEEDDEINYDEASDDYSDMDAGFDDVDEEEEKAVRLAKKEDAYEQMMVEELKRQKEERKRRMLEAKEKERSRGR